MERRQADILIGDLATQLGIPTLALDENNMCMLAIDDAQQTVSIAYDPTAGSFNLVTCLDAIAPSPARIALALAANFERPSAGGASLAIEPSSGTFVLQRRWLTPDLGVGGLPGALLAFLDEAGAWTGRLASIDEAAPTASGPAHGMGLRA